MTTEVEQRIVEMRFDNEQFEKAAKQSLGTLEKLDNILDMLGQGGLEKLSTTLDDVRYRFSTLGVAGAAAIENIANRVVNLTMNLATAIPDRLLSQIQVGGEQRALNIENAKFQLKGLGVAWEEVSDDIDHAVMGTAYGVDEAAKAASILAASGVQYKNVAGEVSDLGIALRSISGIAAMTNSSYDEIANVMGDIFAMGRVSAGEIQRFELRGLNVVSKLSAALHKSEADVRTMMQKGEISAMQFAKIMDEAFGEHATAANETYTGSLRNMNAALSRIGADFYTFTHEGSRKIFLAARQLFDRIRKVTKPFAEGKFAKTIDHLSNRVSYLIETVDLRWLEKIRDFFEKSDSWVKPFDWVIDRLYNANEIMKRLFSAGNGREGVIDRFQWVLDLKKVWSRNIPDALKNIKALFSGIIGDGTLLRNIATNIAYQFGLVAANVAWVANKIAEKLLPHANDINKMLWHIYGLATDVYFCIRDIVEAVARLGGSGFNLLFTIFEKLFGEIKWTGDDNIFSKLSEIIRKLTYDYLIPAIDKLTEFVDQLTELIDKGGSAKDALDSLGGGFGWIGSAIATTIDHLSKFFKYLFQIQEGETIFTKFGQMAKRAGKLIGGSFDNIRKAIAESFGKDGVGETAIDIASALFTILIGYRKVETISWKKGRLGRALEFLVDILTKAYEGLRAFNAVQWADDIETLLRRTSGALRAFADNLNSKSLINIGLAVSALAFGLILLASVTETGSLPSALIALTAAMGILVGALYAIKAISGPGILKDIAKGWKGLGEVFKNSIMKYLNALAMKETAMAALIFAGALAIMAVAVAGLAWAFSKLKLGDIALAVGTLVVMGVLLTGMIAWLTKATEKVGMLDSTKFIAIGVAIAALAVSMVLLSAAVAGLAWAFNKIGNAWAIVGAIGAIIVMMGALVGAIVALNYWTKEVSGVKLALIAAAMIGMSVAVLLLSAAVVGLAYAFQGLDNAWYAVGAVVAIGVMLVAMAGTLAFLSSMLETVPVFKILSIAAALVLMGVAIGIVSLAAVAFAVAIQVGGFLKTVGGMVIVLAAMAGAVALLSALGPKILLGAAAILAVGYAVKIACEGFTALAEGMVILAGALNMLPSDGSLDTIGVGLKSVGKGLAKVAWAALLFNWGDTEAFASLVPLATALYELGKVDIPTLADKKTGLPALANALKSFGSLFGGITSVGARLAAGNVGLLEAGAAFGALGMGLQDLAPGLEAFNGVQDLDSVIANIEALNYAITGLSDFSYSEMYKTMPKLAESLQSISTTLDGLSSDKIRLITDLGDAVSNAFSGDNGEASAALARALQQLAKTIPNNADAFIAESRKLPGYVGQGIEEAQVEISNALLKALYDAGNEINNEQQQRNWEIIGGNIAIGIANGITSRTSEAANAMRNLASALQTSFTVSLAIKSPSRVFEKLAEYVPAGAAEGIQNGTPQVVSAMASMIFPMLDMMSQASDQASMMDMSPRLTPVMDVRGMRKDMFYADRLFNSTALGSFGGMSGLHVNGDAISYNMQNRDVVTEIKHLQTKVSQLGEAFEQMQMVLDTGALVGQMAQPMNNQLGVIAMRERRQ